MEAYPVDHDRTDWSKREHAFQGADPSHLPGRKLVAEACLVDLLAPMLASTNPIPEHIELIIRAGWCGWYAGGVESRVGVLPPDPRTVSRYSSDLRAVAPETFSELLRDLILKLFGEQADCGLTRPLNATCVKGLISRRVPWIHRELVNEILNALAGDGWLRPTSRGFRFRKDALARALPVSPSKVALVEVFQDVYPALSAYTDLQPGAVVGQGWLIATPERLSVLGQTIDAAISGVMAPLSAKRMSLSAERRVVLRIHRLAGLVEESKAGRLDGTAGASDERRRLQEGGNDDARLLAPFVAMGAFPGWGNPEEAGWGLKGAVALRLQKEFQGCPGGLYRAAHRRYGIGNGTLAGYFDGPVLISRNSGKIRAVREGEAFRLESESLRLLSQVFPDSKSERWMWSMVSNYADTLAFQDFRSLLLKLAREGCLLMSKSGSTRLYRATRSYQAKPVLRMWDRWQKLWRWLPALRQVVGAVRHGRPGASVGQGQWVVDRDDLPRIEVQIQNEVNQAVEGELKRFAHLDAVDHLNRGGRKSQIILFSRREPWLLAHMENP